VLRGLAILGRIKRRTNVDEVALGILGIRIPPIEPLSRLTRRSVVQGTGTAAGLVLPLVSVDKAFCAEARGMRRPIVSTELPKAAFEVFNVRVRSALRLGPLQRRLPGRCPLLRARGGRRIVVGPRLWATARLSGWLARRRRSSRRGSPRRPLATSGAMAIASSAVSIRRRVLVAEVAAKLPPVVRVARAAGIALSANVRHLRVFRAVALYIKVRGGLELFRV